VLEHARLLGGARLGFFFQTNSELRLLTLPHEAFFFLAARAFLGLACLGLSSPLALFLLSALSSFGGNPSPLLLFPLKTLGLLVADAVFLEAHQLAEVE
jgi:hypothetical protein